MAGACCAAAVCANAIQGASENPAAIAIQVNLFIRSSAFCRGRAVIDGADVVLDRSLLGFLRAVGLRFDTLHVRDQLFEVHAAESLE